MSGYKPLVTVGMATYNGAEYLSESLGSILGGSYSNIELLVVDDGSTDDSVAIAKRADDSRIRIISNDSNGGLVSIRQQIMQEARGTYLAWLDQDDIAYPNRIESQVAFLECNQNVGACGSWTMHRVHNPSGEQSLRKFPAPGLHEDIRASMPFVNPISFNTATMRISSFRDNDIKFREEYGNTLDYDMWSRAADVMELRNIQEYLGEYRIYPNQTSRGPGAERMLQAAWSVQREVLERNLGVKIEDDVNHVHRRITLTPRLLTSERDATDVGSWLRFLTERNRVLGAYRERAFENALGRQWVVCLLHLSRSIGFAKTMKLAGSSHSITGLRIRNLSYGLHWLMKGQSSTVAHKLTKRRL